MGTMPAPTSAYDLRRHLAADHDLNTQGAAWAELAVLHRDDHVGDPGHTHDDDRAQPTGIA